MIIVLYNNDIKNRLFRVPGSHQGQGYQQRPTDDIFITFKHMPTLTLTHTHTHTRTHNTHKHTWTRTQACTHTHTHTHSHTYPLLLTVYDDDVGLHVLRCQVDILGTVYQCLPFRVYISVYHSELHVQWCVYVWRGEGVKHILLTRFTVCTAFSVCIVFENIYCI